MSMLLPALAGASLLVVFLFGSTAKAEKEVKEEVDSLDDDQKSDVKEAAQAVKDEDWMTAVAAVLKSDSAMAMEEVAAALKKAGLKEEAADLLEIAKAKKAKKKKEPKLSKPKKTEPKKEEPKKPPTLAKPKDTLAAKKAKEAADRVRAEEKKKAEAEAKKKKAEEKKKAEAEAKKKAEEKAKKQALLAEAQKLKAHLASTGRYKENLALVEAYQRHNNLTPDSKYGVKTAKTFWSTYKLVPVNPFYWPASNTSKELAAYQAFLDSIKVDAPQHTAEVDKLKKTVGK